MFKDMLIELEDAFIARDSKRVEKAYKALERVGVDRYTALTVLNSLKEEKSIAINQNTP